MRFGYRTSAFERTKPPASKWFDAPGPLRKKSQRAPMYGRFHFFSAGCTDTGCVDSCWTYTSR